MIRWWVSHPVNQDNYCVFIVGDDPMRPDWTRYYAKDEWHDVPLGGIIEPAIVLPGFIVHQMVASGREPTDEIVQILKETAEEVWEAERLRRKEEITDVVDAEPTEVYP